MNFNFGVPGQQDEIKVVFEEGIASRTQWEEFRESTIWRDIEQFLRDSKNQCMALIGTETDPIQVYRLQGSYQMFDRLLGLPELFLMPDDESLAAETINEEKEEDE